MAGVGLESEFRPDVFFHDDGGDRSIRLESKNSEVLSLGDVCLIGKAENRIIRFSDDGHWACNSATKVNCASCVGNGQAEEVKCQSPIGQKITF